MKYYENEYWSVASIFRTRFGGYPHSSDPSVKKRYQTASPKDYREDLEIPLLTIQGIDDEAVPIAQQNELVSDLVQQGRNVEMVYYPGERHVFERKQIWRDALSRILEFFDTQLNP